MNNFIELGTMGMSYFVRGQLTVRKFYFFTENLIRGYAFRTDSTVGLPSILVIEPTNACNLRCVGCSFQQDHNSTNAKRSFLSLDIYKKVIDDLKGYVVVLFLYMGGEPFLHPELFEMIQYASERKIAVIISTNGNFHINNWGERIIDSGLDRIIFSISGTNQGVYKKHHRGGDLDLVVKNIESLVDTRSNRGAKYPKIYLRYLEVPENEQDRHNAERFSKSLGVDSLEIRQDNRRLSYEGNPSGQKKGKKKEKGIPNFCFWLWTTTVINSKGEVTPCCFEYFNIPKFGNIYQESIRKIWHSSQYNQFRKQILRNRKDIPCCTICNTKMGFQNQAFELTKDNMSN
jgi:radical SAM protein with 4Fe4S-binding SPASM domain